MFRNCLIALILALAAIISFTPASVRPAAPRYEYELNADGQSYKLVHAEADGIESVTVPTQYNRLPVTDIGSFAFKDCEGLTSIVVPDGVLHIEEYAFSYCSKLQEVILPDSVTEMGGYPFTDCPELRFVRLSGGIPDMTLYTYRINGDISMTELFPSRAGVFNNTGNLELIEFPEGVVNLGSRVIASDIDPYLGAWADLILPASLETVHPNALGRKIVKIRRIFYRGTWEESDRISWPDLPINVYCYSETEPEEDGLFWHMENGIPTVWGPGDRQFLFTLLEDGSGYSVKSLPGNEVEELVIPSMFRGLPVKEIEDAGFMGREDFRRIVIPETVERIGRHAFNRCTSLERLDIPAGVTELGESFCALCTDLKEVTIPGTVQEIPELAFMHDIALERVTMREGIRGVRYAAFEDCDALKSISFPDSITEWENCLLGCDVLETIHLSAGVTNYRWPPTGLYFHCDRVTYLEIPDTVLFMGGPLGGRGTEGLRELVIPAGIQTGISSVIDYDWSMIERLYFKGSPEAWKEFSANAHFTLPPVYFYSEEEPADPGAYWHYVDGRAQPWETE